MDAHQVLRKVDVQAKLLYVTLTNSIAPTSLACVGGPSGSGAADYGAEFLSAYSNAGKQLDALYAELEPALSLCAPVPAKGSASSVIGAVKVSDLLCAAVAPCDIAALVLPKHDVSDVSAMVMQVRVQVQKHNELMEDVLANYSDCLDSAKEKMRADGKRKRLA